MSHPIVHAEIRSSDPDATRKFFGDLFGWTYPTEGAYPGYTFVDTGVPDALYTAISPLQGDSDLVTFFIGVDDMAGAIEKATGLGAKVVQEPVTVPGVQFALISDPLGHVVGWHSSSDAARAQERRSRPRAEESAPIDATDEAFARPYAGMLP